MAAILGLSGRDHHYVFELTRMKCDRGRVHLESLGVDLRRTLIGLNTGAGDDGR